MIDSCGTVHYKEHLNSKLIFELCGYKWFCLTGAVRSAFSCCIFKTFNCDNSNSILFVFVDGLKLISYGVWTLEGKSINW